jgi:hypothetical protein
MKRGGEMNKPLESRTVVRLIEKEGSRMDLLDKRGQRIRLTRLDSEVLADPVTDGALRGEDLNIVDAWETTTGIGGRRRRLGRWGGRGSSEPYSEYLEEP